MATDVAADIAASVTPVCRADAPLFCFFADAFIAAAIVTLPRDVALLGCYAAYFSC